MPVRTTYVYCVVEDGTVFCKVGVADDPYARLRALQTGNPRRLSIYAVMRGSKRDEVTIHAVFARRRLVGEWFDDTSGELRGWFDRHDALPLAAPMLREPFAFVGSSKRVAKCMPVVH